MALQDFTIPEWVEVDPNNHITATEHHIDFEDYRNETAYKVRDMGADYFHDFIHHVDINRITHTGAPVSWVWGLANAVNGDRELRDAGEDFLCLAVSAAAPVCNFGICEYKGGVIQDHMEHAIEEGVPIYVKLVKAGTSLVCHVYNNPDRAPEHELEWSPLSITLTEDYKFRYIYVCNTYNDGLPDNGDIDIDNLDLAIAPPEAPPTLAQILAGVPATIWAVLALIIVVIVVAIYVMRKK